MAQVLPVLDPPRYARLFGPATHILFAPHHEWGADCVVARNVTAAMNVTPARGALHWDRKRRYAALECYKNASSDDKTTRKAAEQTVSYQVEVPPGIDFIPL